MKDLNYIDNLFTEAIEPYEFSPSENVWNSIEGKLQQRATRLKEKTIRNLRITLGVLTASFFLFVAYHYYNPKQENKIAAKTNPEIKTNSNTVLPAKTIDANIPEKSAGEFKNVTPSSPLKTQDASGLVKNENVSPGNLSQNAQPTQSSVADLHADDVNKNPEEKKQQAHKISLPGIENKNKENIVSSDHVQKKEVVSSQNIQTDAVKKKEPEAVNAENKENIVYVPNAFTPNGDGLNDVFLPKATEEPGEYKLYIYDCHGNTVFFSDDFNKGWDGKIQINGVETVKEDAYLWRMEIKNNKGEKERSMGYITLLK